MKCHQLKSYQNKGMVYLILIGFIILLNQRILFSQADSSFSTILNRAYSMLDIDIKQSEKLFEEVVSIDPTNVTIRRQLGYVYNSNEKYESALREFTIADSLSPSDTTKLDIAHVLIRLERKTEAETIVRELQNSISSDIRNRVEIQFPASFFSISSKWWSRIYLAPYYDTRWKTSFFYADFQQGYFLSENKKLSAFGFLSLSGDARSKGGLASEVFTDNAMIIGFGLSAKPFIGFEFKVQQGVAFSLIDIQTRPNVMSDFRAIAIYGNGIYPSFSYHEDVQFPLSVLADVYSSLGYYSRYKNCIWYLQPKAGIRLVEISYSVIDAYLKGALVLDAEKKFYNNIVEGGIGVQITPNVKWGLHLRGEFNRGRYLDIGTSPNPYSKYYDSFRFFIIFERVF